MKFLSNLSVRNKLILLAILPFSVVLYFLQKTIAIQWTHQEINAQTQQDLEAIEKIANLIHSVQNEQSFVTVLDATQHENKTEILRLQEQTNQSLANLEQFFFRTRTSNAQIDSLLLAIKQRDPLQTTGKDKITLALLNEIGKVWRYASNMEIKNQQECVLFVLYAQEFLSMIRNELYRAMHHQDFQQNEYGIFAANKGKFEINLHKFRNYTTPGLLEYYDNTYSKSPAVIAMQATIDSAFTQGHIPAAAAPEEWMQQTTAAIDALHACDLRAFDMMRTSIQAEAKDISAAYFRNILLSGIVIIVLIIISVLSIKEIANSVNRMKEATERITHGDINFTLDISSRDEMGQLARSFNHMITVFKGYVQLAESIGEGDYQTDVSIRSDQDALGKALVNMKTNLLRLSQEKETRAWLLAGNHELNAILREEKDVRSLATDIIGHVAAYLKAQVGALYLLENGQLYLTGSYALENAAVRESFAVGQSLVGQAAQSKKYILVDNVPDDYIKITSSIGQSIPANILVFPFFYIGKVKGVIEIAATHAFTPLDMEYLQMIGNSIAIAFNSSQSRVRLKELLEETQHQAEELESQQEELRQFNDELLEKLESIEKSEAELKVQQEELQESNALLEEKANLLENEKQQLEKAKTEIESKAQEFESLSKYKSEFLANMSHELRTPLNSILILTQLLLENKNNSLTEKELKYAHVIYNSGNELLTLINDILDLSKVEAGKMDIDIDKFTFVEVNNDLTMMFSQVAKSKSIHFKIEVLPGYNKVVESDKQRVVQILRNLLSNAFKFTPAGGEVKLSIHPPAANVRLQNIPWEKIADVVAFSVSDTGIGIQKDKQEMIFEAFRQVDSTDKRKYGGTGLGLSICRELSGLLGGEIHLESEEGKGSTFTLYLPLTYTGGKQEHHTSHTTMVEAKPRIPEYIPDLPKIEKRSPDQEDIPDDDRYTLAENSRRVLIIEDDKEFAQVLLAFVRERNYKGIISHHGNTALHYTHAYKPDAILLDMKLPDMDGTEVIRQLKSDPEQRHIPVQIISGYSMKREAMKLGAFDFIKKPIRKEDLQHVFDKLEDFANRKYKRLLIVENNEMDNQAMRDMIGNGDVHCIPAYSCTQAYDLMTESAVDCVIVDLGLPDTSCFTLLEKIKANEQLNAIPVIVYAAQDLTEEENKKLTRLANTVVLKTAYSYERLLDETTLFLHRVEANLPQEKQNIIRKLHRSDAVLEGKIVLIVDDDMRNIYSLTNVLEDEGLTCLTAENGREAIEVLNANPSIDIILMDVMMPEMDGYEATMTIRKSGKYTRLPIIALTAKAMKGDREKCLAAGMSDYVTKPVNTRQLLSLMRVWLYKS